MQNSTLGCEQIISPYMWNINEWQFHWHLKLTTNFTPSPPRTQTERIADANRSKMPIHTLGECNFAQKSTQKNFKCSWCVRWMGIISRRCANGMQRTKWLELWQGSECASNSNSAVLSPLSRVYLFDSRCSRSWDCIWCWWALCRFNGSEWNVFIEDPLISWMSITCENALNYGFLSCHTYRHADIDKAIIEHWYFWNLT